MSNRGSDLLFDSAQNIKTRYLALFKIQGLNKNGDTPWNIVIFGKRTYKAGKWKQQKRS
ncbi:hypothetical protein VIBNISOn1_30076 [Vibrio nigripulchritudo SOn1]|uniref:Uncharacterized protein n=1 Tax=Vibrio nigripulchritudo SOn1 TaxID=1238450 RepID=A0AAV2VSK4_9VIBR|nr:hypothetical protein VIBNISOn1_30076 [Vibrio nigripulchritudo SOn1]